ncbi:MAG: SHOCT-like domain-containing protein [Bacillota bacterium]
MNEDKLRILQMIENGTITPQEGSELLKALKSDTKSDAKPPKKQAFKMFKIRILSSDGDKVNVQIPLEFAKMVLKSPGKKGIPKLDKLKEIDPDFDFSSIVDMIEAGTVGKLVDIQSNDGDIVEIVVE